MWDVGIDILEVLCAMKIPQEFTAETMAQTEAIPEELTEEDFAGRDDYRSEITYTIDGEDSKDLDDAIHVKKLENGNYELGVHIADVSHYVWVFISLTFLTMSLTGHLWMKRLLHVLHLSTLQTVSSQCYL